MDIFEKCEGIDRAMELQAQGIYPYFIPLEGSEGTEVEIGGMVRHNVDAAIIPDGLEISLLGQSYLAQIGSVEINGSQMVMSGN